MPGPAGGNCPQNICAGKTGRFPVQWMTERMEPERHIEKLLRAYAKKRRAQAGDPLELHPATRRRLQGEVARNAPQPDDEDASMTLWELFRRQWAVLLGFALMVFFVATLLLPGLGAAKNKAQKTAAMTKSHLIEIGTAVRMFAEDNHERLPVSLDELTNELQLDLANTIFIDPQSGRQFVYVGGGKYLGTLPGNSVLAYSPTDKKGRAVLFADGRVEVINGARFSELTNREVQELAFAKDSAHRRLAETSGEITAASHGFARAGASGSQNLFKNISPPTQAVPVLVNFQVQQNGNAIRIVDADGSVYAGSLLPESAVAQNEPAPAATPAPPVTAPAQAGRAKTVASREEPPTAHNYFFRVAGTNRTLKQNVVFAGNLVAMASATTNLQQSLGGNGGLEGGGGGGGGQLQSVLTNQNPLPWSGSRIAGTAVIAGTNHIEINAVPLSP
jgi:hypothetical protein